MSLKTESNLVGIWLMRIIALCHEKESKLLILLCYLYIVLGNSSNEKIGVIGLTLQQFQ